MVDAKVEDMGSVPISEAPARQPVRVAGTIMEITYEPPGAPPGLEARLQDKTGSIRLVWLGRRRIAGINPGTRLVAEGRIVPEAHGRAMMDPRYELIHPGRPL
jgi:hypothetical protein